MKWPIDPNLHFQNRNFAMFGSFVSLCNYAFSKGGSALSRGSALYSLRELGSLSHGGRTKEVLLTWKVGDCKSCSSACHACETHASQNTHLHPDFRIQIGKKRPHVSALVLCAAKLRATGVTQVSPRAFEEAWSHITIQTCLKGLTARYNE